MGNKFKNSILIGDININLFKNIDIKTEYLNIFSEYGYLSIINKPTRQK